MLFRRIVLCALLAGALAGLLASVVQHWQVIPIIAAAEGFEGAVEGAAPLAASAHDHAAHEHGGAHGHDAAGHDEPAHDGDWAPTEGAERHAWTAIANVLTAIGFGLVLVAAMTTWEQRRGRPVASARNGLLWGVAGWISVFAVPALGLPPEIPGSAAAALEARQIWWLLAVASSAAGLALLAFVRGRPRWLGLAVLALPFAVGAPHLEGGAFAAYGDDIARQMEGLAGRFAVAAALASAVQWLAIGVLSGWAVARWVRPVLADPALNP